VQAVHGASKSDPWYSEVPVSDKEDLDSDQDTRPGEPGGADSGESGAKVETDDDELDELDGLDGQGFDRAVADARGRVGIGDDPDVDERPYTRDEAGLSNRVGWGRSPIISVAVIIVGLFLLAATWSDFRYFLRSLQSEPRDLGQVGDIYADGEFSERFDDEWVVLEGNPDVQHAARMPSKDGWIGFMRLIEGDASMFVAIPRETRRSQAPTRSAPRRWQPCARWKRPRDGSP
jgi:hypothetical protein